MDSSLPNDHGSISRRILRHAILGGDLEWRFLPDRVRMDVILPSDDGVMRVRNRVARVQSLERLLNATDEETAVAKIESELQKPYGLLGWWRS
jgi:hypothetical protein